MDSAVFRVPLASRKNEQHSPAGRGNFASAPSGNFQEKRVVFPPLEHGGNGFNISVVMPACGLSPAPGRAIRMRRGGRTRSVVNNQPACVCRHRARLLPASGRTIWTRGRGFGIAISPPAARGHGRGGVVARCAGNNRLASRKRVAVVTPTPEGISNKPSLLRPNSAFFGFPVRKRHQTYFL